MNGRASMGRGTVGTMRPVFAALLQDSLAASLALGGGTPTFARGSTATVMGYGPTDTFGLLTCAVGEARFMGARRVSQGVWSRYFSNGSLITPANGGDATVCDASGPFGYLSEGQRANLCLWSTDFSQAVWTVINGGTGTVAVKTPNFAVAPDGTSTACRLQANRAAGSTASDYSLLRQAEATNAVKTQSVWLKSNTGLSQNVLLQGGGGAPAVVTVTTAWQRFTQTKVSGATPFDIGTQGDAGGTASIDVLVWGPQLEAAAFASSYIPTTTVAVTRNADVLTYPSVGNVDGAAGTFAAGVVKTADSTTANMVAFGGGGASGQYVAATGGSTNTLFAYDGTGTASKVGFTTAARRIAVTWQPSGVTAYVDGAAGTPAAFDGNFDLAPSFGIGTQVNGTFALFGTLRNVRLFTKALPDAVLATL